MANAEIGKSIRTLRESAGYTQSGLARFLSVDQSLVSKVEQGARGLSTDALATLASLCGVDVCQIVGGEALLPKLSLAFRGGELTVEDMESIAAINRIALNSEFMSALLEEGAA